MYICICIYIYIYIHTHTYVFICIHLPSLQVKNHHLLIHLFAYDSGTSMPFSRQGTVVVVS